MLEKQLAIYQSVTFHGSDAKGGSSSEEDSITWSQLVYFTVVAGLWLLQQALIASNLCAEFDISVAELDAIRFGFSQYDTQLSGEIPAGDVFYLLQVKTSRTTFTCSNCSVTRGKFESRGGMEFSLSQF